MKKWWYILAGLAVLLIGVVAVYYLTRPRPFSYPPQPQMILSRSHAKGEVCFEFIQWQEGLMLLRVDDISKGSHGFYHKGLPNSPAYVVGGSGAASMEPGARAFKWELQTADGREGNFRLDGKEHDLSKGALIVVRTNGDAIQVLQLKRDLSGVPFDVHACRDYLKNDAEVMKFLETGAAPK